MENGKATVTRAWRTGWMALVLTFSILHLPFSISVSANPTQEDVFKSINESVGQSVDGTKVLAMLAAAVGIVIVLVLFNRRQVREATPRALNHQGKLMREMAKTAGLKPAEARQLKVLAEALAAAGEPLQSPITLMLCPSLMKRARDGAAGSAGRDR